MEAIYGCGNSHPNDCDAIMFTAAAILPGLYFGCSGALNVAASLAIGWPAPPIPIGGANGLAGLIGAFPAAAADAMVGNTAA
jgi:hypothetical protein